MELVEGPTLAERIARADVLHRDVGRVPRPVRRSLGEGGSGPAGLPIDEALSIAKQIADALEAAHERGIIHRDLKPANIKLRPDGVVKVLDFGLAKLNDPHGANDPNAFSNSPTLSLAATQAGMILGTAGYMSPEQAKGRTVDKRSDVWSFGAVLYEMLTGRRAFDAADVSDTLAAVLMKEPDWDALPATTPPRVTAVLRRCLQKDRTQRARDIADVALALEGAFETTAPQTAASPAAPARGTRLAWIVAAVAVLVAGGLTAPAVRHLRETPPPPPPETRADISTPATTNPTFALSPDGRQLALVASDGRALRLWLRPLGATSTQPLPGTEGASSPFWSPDSKSVAFFADAKLKRIEVSGGLPLAIADAPVGRGGTWNEDGVILFAPTANSPLFRVPASGGAAVAVTTLERHVSHRYPFFLPDGRQFLFFAGGTPDSDPTASTWVPWIRPKPIG